MRDDATNEKDTVHIPEKTRKKMKKVNSEEKL